MADQTGGTAVDSTAAPPAPPLPQRRPRVREVSSRFMSPLIQSNSTPIPTPNSSDFARSKSVHRRHPPKTDENLIPDSNRSLDKSSAAVPSTVQRKQQQQLVKQHIKERGESNDHQRSNVSVSSRPDTPITTGTDRVVSSRYRQVSNSISRSNSLNSGSNGCSATVSAAARLLQEATSDEEKKLSRISTSSRHDSDSNATASNQGSSSCPNSPLCVPVNQLHSVHDARSSMSDVDKWLAEKNYENSGKVTSDCARSLNFPSSLKMGTGIARPPHPQSSMRSGLDIKKGRKVCSNHQEDVHTLKMLFNHYLLWRFVNAKAEVSKRAQKLESERKLCSLGAKISGIRDNVKRKRSELSMLQGIKTLSTIVEAQMPYLDEWPSLEEDYSNSLSGATTALQNSSVRIPLSGEVRVDVGQLREALNSALELVEMILSQIQRFVQKAEEMDISIAELAMLVGGERRRLEECGHMLSKNYSSQVRECCLRGTLMQLHYSSLHYQPHPHKTETEVTS